ncbi:MAG: peptidoglycan-binding domain-containing protein [Bryobacteraceae bacterium]|nr:peptidoglycan-binding domain-containing protein [Bryobacteraceae bacterium]
MVRILTLLLAVLLVLPAAAAAPASSKKKSGTTKRVSPAKPGASAQRSKKAAAGKRRGRRPATAARRGPAAPSAPSPERYREIQQALIERGYLQGEPTGVWGPDSVEALKRFQQAQNLQASGRLNALSLISLGLGPRREAPAQPAKPDVVQP